MLWTFGDSFSLPRDHINNGEGIDHPLWLEMVGSNLNEERYFNAAEWGVSNEYILDTFYQQYPNINKDDYVIIQLTSAYRQWFFLDKPDLGNYYINNIDKHISNDEHTALKHYIEHLRNEKADQIRYKSAEYCLKYIAIKSPFKMLILPGFDPVDNINGTLLNVCDGEFISDQTRDAWYKKHGADPRANHMSPKNHVILSNKVTEYFKCGIIPDLSRGFVTDFL
jgi:hypothetical protein